MKRISTILALLVCGVFLAAVYVGVLYYGSNRGVSARRVEIRVLPGAYLRDVETMLVDAGLLKHRRLFRYVAVLTHKDRKVQAGRYLFEEGESVAAILHKLSHAEFEVTRFIVPEGYMLREIAAAAQREIEIDSAQFFNLANDSAYAKELGINAPSLEGYLFPDTYLLSWPLSSRELARIMLGRFREVYDMDIARYARDAGLSVNEIVTLASIIQAEAQNESEMPRISAVYYNRLKQGLRLEADPTVAYALGGIHRGLRYSDLRVNSPYNTYRNRGLPPGPICSPGLKALIAAVRPLEGCDDLYFVADGTGSHFFSKTLDEHVKAKSVRRAPRDTIQNDKDSGTSH
jgi:UPF0755 protein